MTNAVTDLTAITDSLSEPDYHSHAALSQSGAKTLLQSPARFHYERTHPRPPSTAMEHGSIAHGLVLGSGPEIAVLDFPDWRTKAAQLAADEARDAGAVPVLTKDYERIGAMANRLGNHELAMELLDAATVKEVSFFATCPVTGVPMRGRADALTPTLILDYKTSAKPDARTFGKSASDYGYHIQAGWYLDLLEYLGQPRDGFAFIVQSKVAPYEVAVVELVPSAVNYGRDLGLTARERFRDCTASGLWPGAVDPRAVLVVDLPPWGYRDSDYTEEVAT